MGTSSSSHFQNSVTFPEGGFVITTRRDMTKENRHYYSSAVANTCTCQRSLLALVSYTCSAHAAWPTHHFFWGATLIIHALVFDFIFVVSLPPFGSDSLFNLSRITHPSPRSPGRLDSDSQPIRVLLLSGSRQSLFSPRPPKRGSPQLLPPLPLLQPLGHCHS